MKQTENIKLMQFEGADKLDYKVINENWKKIDDAFVDHVVEQGTSGTWTYRKWNSGLAECWCNIEYSGIKINDAFTAERIMCNKMFPFVFTELPNITYGLGNGAGWHHLIPYVLFTNEKFESFDIVSMTNPGTVSLSGTVSVYVKGRWK